jgi:hypothetical protein
MIEEASTTSKPKRTMLPFLIVLFLVSYGLLATLVVEQNRTITAQRSLIQQLFGDSLQLVAMKKAATQHAVANAQSSKGVQHDKAKAGPVRKAAPQKPPKDASDTPDARRNLVSI